VFSDSFSFFNKWNNETKISGNVSNSFDVFFQYKWTGENLSEFYNTFRNKELISIRNFFLEELQQKEKVIGFVNTSSNSKLRHLVAILKSDLKIPKTIICNNKEALVQHNFNDSLILKAIQNVDFEKTEKNAFTYYTERKKMTDLDDNFFPLTIQEEVTKVVEIRCFIFFNKCYALAYIPNNDSEIVDIRLQYTEDNIEVYPYQLPQEIIDKLRKALDELNLDMASIDLILDEQGEYITLDINPHGQISQLSLELYPHIERDIAQYIIQNYGRHS
jgi:glutathione synthase/RimK-type ligase-like ATP-grasp enzyme